jgi:hypothetical protein
MFASDAGRLLSRLLIKGYGITLNKDVGLLGVTGRAGGEPNNVRG